MSPASKQFKNRLHRKERKLRAKERKLNSVVVPPAADMCSLILETTHELEIINGIQGRTDSGIITA